MASGSQKATLQRPKMAFLSGKKLAERKVATIVVSDIHLGSSVSRVKKLTELIEKKYREGSKYLFDQLILLGDIFDRLDLKRLGEADWEFLSLIQNLSEPESGVKVVWLNGNHDTAVEPVIQDFFDTSVVRDYEWDYEGKRFIATHGDRFDKFVEKRKFASEFFSNIYLGIQKIDFKNQPISRFIKRMSKKIYLPKKVREDMLAYARGKSADVIFCGHTHHAESVVAPDGIAYFNSGCWTDVPSTYLTVGTEGIHIHEVW
jgi:UDP-2,3-diacylglucosamine pyrophosphatase LpxH